MPKEKPDLILVNGFPVNSKLGRGIEDYLKDYFTLHPIYFPGFECNIKPFEKITLNQYKKWVTEGIDKLGLEEYIIASISFGSLIVNQIKLNHNKCKFILSAEPFYTIDQLNIGMGKKIFSKLFVRIVCNLKMYNVVWNQIKFNKTLRKIVFGADKPSKYIEAVLENFDAKTFFETALILLNYKDVKINNCPQIIMVNPNDKLLKTDLTIELLKDNISTNHLRVIVMNQNHYPYPATYEHFKQTFTKNEIQQVFDFYKFVKENETLS